MNVYVVMLEDPFASHFIGVYATREAAQRYVELQDREEIDGEQYTISEVTVHSWVRKHGTGRCKSSLSYYHSPRVVTLIIMAIRKSIAAQFSKAAKALENDTSKEQAGSLILALRVGIANVIMPNIPPVKR